MTDVDGSGPIPRRTPRTSDGGAPVSGALAIVLAVIAVVAGFLILRSISGDDERQLGVGDGGGAAAGGVDTSTATAPESTVPGGSTVPTTPPTTQPPDVFTGATVMVVNANFQSGTAGQMSRAIEGRGFQMEEGTEKAEFGMALVSVTWHPGGGGFFLRTGVGRGFTTLALDAPDSADWDERESPAALLGLGYEWRLGRQFALGVALEAYGTELDDLPTFQNTNLGVGLASVQLQWYL